MAQCTLLLKTLLAKCSHLPQTAQDKAPPSVLFAHQSKVRKPLLMSDVPIYKLFLAAILNAQQEGWRLAGLWFLTVAVGLLGVMAFLKGGTSSTKVFAFITIGLIRRCIPFHNIQHVFKFCPESGPSLWVVVRGLIYAALSPLIVFLNMAHQPASLMFSTQPGGIKTFLFLPRALFNPHIVLFPPT